MNTSYTHTKLASMSHARAIERLSLGFRVQGSGFRVQVQGLEFRIYQAGMSNARATATNIRTCLMTVSFELWALELGVGLRGLGSGGQRLHGLGF